MLRAAQSPQRRSITRKQFLDRVMSLDELQSLTNMLRLWFPLKRNPRRETGYARCQASVFAFARSDAAAMRELLAQENPDCRVDQSDPDELRIIAPFQPVTSPANLSLWRTILGNPIFRNTCLIFEFTIHGFASKPDHFPLSGTTFVFVGSPASDSTLLLKTLWAHGLDPSMSLVYRATAWQHEAHFLHTFESFLLSEPTIGPERAAQQTFARFITIYKALFFSRKQDEAVHRIVRRKAELPDDRTPAGFARRLVPPLAGALLATAVAAWRLYYRIDFIGLAAVFSATSLYLVAGRIIWKKLQRIHRYLTAMRKGLGNLYANPVTYVPIDLSTDTTPTLLKYVRELEARKAKHLLDITFKTANKMFNANRLYALGNTTISIGLLRQTENLTFFPSRPILMLSTRFTDGRKHSTANHDLFRKPFFSNRTARCLTTASLDDLLALHDREVNKLIAQGSAPITPTPELELENMKAEFEENRARWQERRYSWSDAIHQSFKIPRRQYRP